MQSTASETLDYKDGSALPTADSTMSPKRIRLVTASDGFEEAFKSACRMAGPNRKLEGKEALCEKIFGLVAEMYKIGGTSVEAHEKARPLNLAAIPTTNADPRDSLRTTFSHMVKQLGEIAEDLDEAVCDVVEDADQGSESGETAHDSCQSWKEPSEDTINRLVDKSRDVFWSAYVFKLACDEYKQAQEAAAS